ncbi:MAG: M23 family metallopeptidase [bacterium]|jgi:hypothetical protein|nr:M23 family metallopeptidase [bacterium]
MSMKRILRVLWFCLMTLPLLVILSGCGTEFIAIQTLRGDMGGAQRVLELPLALGAEHLCVQGAWGDYSHSGASTRYDLDLDTSNVIDEEVYAPAGGVVRVHDGNASSGFGYHVNIDLGDGTYVVIAHLSEIFLSDGDEVAAGQLIAYEGMTGYAQGDHIHLGLHQGDAGEDAANGVSIPVLYRVVNQTERGEVELLSSEDFVCGIRAQGDAQDGHFYQSQLPVTMWHPNGTLVKTPDNAQTYVLEQGRTRWIENESVFWSYNYSFQEVTLISDEELACYGEGQDLTLMTAIDAFFDAENQLWLVLGSEDGEMRVRHPVRGIGWEHVLRSWGLSYDRDHWPDTFGGTHAYVMEWEPSSRYIGLRDGTLVTEVDAPDLFVISDERALPVVNWESYLMLGFLDRSVLEVEDGTVGELHLVGDCSSDQWCVDALAVTTCGGGMDLSGGESGGSDDYDSDEDSSDQGSDDDTDSDSGDTGDVPGVDDCAGVDACVVDLDGDGLDETLLMAGDSWLDLSAIDLPAYVYGNGGCFDGSLSGSDQVVVTAGGFYAIDFAARTHACSVQLTLISSLGAGEEMGQWLWWQNAPFCSGGSDMCELMDNGTSWEEWLLAVRWDPETGLVGDGNGFTRNSQL